MGLLDEGFLTSPAGIGLMSAIAGGLASARRGAPMNTIGQAGIAGLMGYSNAQRWQSQQAENEMQNRMRKMQLDQATRQQEAIERMAGSLPENQRTVAQAFPQQFAQSLFKEPVKPQLVTVQTENGPVQRWIRPGEATGVDIGAPADKESALPWYVKKTPEGRMMIDPAYSDLEKTKASFARQPMQPVAYVDANGNTVWGTIAEAKGKPAANYSPTLQGQLSQAKEAGKTLGEEQTKAQLDMPRIISNSETALRLSDELVKHPGFGTAVGKSSMLGVQKVPGTEAYDFMNRLGQLRGGAFLEAFNTLKGGGQITEVEGKKATDAIARMDNATSEAEFRAAVKDYQDVIRNGMNRAKLRAGNKRHPTQPGGVQFLGFE